MSGDDEPICPICQFKVKKWGRATCDICGSVVCSKHRPMFDFSGEKPKYVSFWMCDKCKENLQQSPNDREN